jgi:hypothetical protein
MEKKIATSVDILINVARYEHLSVTKYAEKKITYSSSEDMAKQEDELTSELISDIKRTLKKLSEGFGSKVKAVNDFEDKIQKKIPEWLEDGPEPNIANIADKNHVEAEVEAHAQEIDDKLETNSTATELDELFGPDEDEEEDDTSLNEIGDEDDLFK